MGNGITTASTFGTSPSSSVNQVSSEVTTDDFVRSLTIGEGGFSKVLACMHVDSKTWLAMKETSIEKSCGTKLGLSALRAEVSILAHLSREEHPFIVHLHFAFRDDRKCYMALDLHCGGDLRCHMRNHKKVYREKIVAFYAICLSSALHYVHEKGILHRDIKPENVILDAQGYPHLTDFGVSTMLRGPKKELISNSSSGTRQYLAPEVFSKTHRHGVEADFWSLGVMLYELVYGQRPFKDHCPMVMINFHNDLQAKKVFLSSTSYRFASSSASASNIALEVTDSAGAIPSSSCTLTSSGSASASSVPPSTAVSDHEDHVEATIKSNVALARRLDTLQQEALHWEKKSCSGSGDFMPISYDLGGFVVPSTSPSRGQFPRREELPPSHRPLMPKTNIKNREISVACIAVLEGLMDVRLWRRLGAGSNYSSLQKHVWFQEQKLTWESVLTRKEPALYVPNLDRISRELQFKHGNDDDCHSDNDTSTTLSLCTKQEAILKDFYFVAHKYGQDEDGEKSEDHQKRGSENENENAAHKKTNETIIRKIAVAEIKAEGNFNSANAEAEQKLSLDRHSHKLKSRQKLRSNIKLRDNNIRLK